MTPKQLALAQRQELPRDAHAGNCPLWGDRLIPCTCGVSKLGITEKPAAPAPAPAAPPTGDPTIPCRFVWSDPVGTDGRKVWSCKTCSESGFEGDSPLCEAAAAAALAEIAKDATAVAGEQPPFHVAAGPVPGREPRPGGRLEMLDRLHDTERQLWEARELAATYAKDRKELAEQNVKLMDAMTAQDQVITRLQGHISRLEAQLAQPLGAERIIKET
jgi:hypothetical protein